MPLDRVPGQPLYTLIGLAEGARGCLHICLLDTASTFPSQKRDARCFRLAGRWRAKPHQRRQTAPTLKVTWHGPRRSPVVRVPITEHEIRGRNLRDGPAGAVRSPSLSLSHHRHLAPRDHVSRLS